MQTDIFQDTYSYFQVPGVLMEVVVAPYPSIPTNMEFQDSPFPAKNRLPSAGDDSVLFKANTTLIDSTAADLNQFPSLQIASNQKLNFYRPFVHHYALNGRPRPGTQKHCMEFYVCFRL